MLRFEFCIPIEKIHPAFVEVVWREPAPVVVKILDRRLKRHVHRPHVELFARLVRFAQVTGRAGRDHVFPGCQATLGSWNEMIECKLFFRAAILALKFVAKEDVEAGEGGISAGFDKGLEGDDARQSEFEARTSDRRIIFGNDIHPIKEDCLDRVLPRPQSNGGLSLSRQRAAAHSNVVNDSDARCGIVEF